MAKDSSEILGRVSNLEQDDSSRDIYDDWSQDYDAHLQSEFGYISPRVAALREHGFVSIDGVDISTGMLEQARAKQVYRNLLCADLTARIPLEDDCYGAGLCVGSLGAGHVGAQHVAEILRPIRRDGLFVLTMNGSYYQAENFEQTFRQMQDDGLWSIVKLEEFNYMTRLVRPGWLLVAVKQ
jgi:SAM-dependent methyltransferase